MYEKAKELIKRFEGCELTAYKCPADIWTIGYGHTANVQPNETITQQQADMLLDEDLQIYADQTRSVITVLTTDNQFNALLDFVYNLGIGNFKSSTLLKLLNQGKHTEAAEQFVRWNKAGGKVLAGLTARRLAEKELFLSDN